MYGYFLGLFKYLLKKYLRNNDTLFFSFTLLELTNEEVKFQKDVSFLTKLRFKLIESSTANRLKKTINYF